MRGPRRRRGPSCLIVDDKLRAEEIIVEVYRLRNAAVAGGARPERVVMSQEHYRTVQEYRAHLGEVPEGRTDYIDRYRLFDLEICIERVERPRVE